MKKLVLSLITLASVSAVAKSIPAGTYSVDPAHSKIGFEIPHLVISSVEGRFSTFDGSVTIEDKLEKSKANLNVDVSSIDTNNKDRDDHLRSADFFDVAKNPKLTFVVKKISGTPEALKLTGDLTIKGKTKSVTLDAKYLGDVNDAYGNQKIAFTAEGKINRKDFGLSWNNVVEAGPVVGDEVTLKIKIQAGRPLAKK
ncbi:hypothetical protein AZI86_08735 [Bdellovibrio bacteriovorus]|uniref:Lipid/polyisoprenoid-binding YceI-like domain-containing protein n=1 Tax=Bdellovibrio bacteriovorus TaxID=959 RepID=A0A150WRY7_BDEBC|nr:YceI family protein [Bdellovibrio bacteriovorus]KYG67087.1 hypothetical protein AZI86_08735 [Bdellovibrio bacteriovorus]